MGGSTDGIHRLMLFLPPLCPSLSSSVPAFSMQPWIPLQAALNPVMLVPPAPEPLDPLEHAHQVHRHGLEVFPFFLFLATSLTAQVQVPCVFNTPVKWGLRQLTQQEEATLWDVLLFLQEHIPRDVWSTMMLSRFLRGVPVKTLLLGSDFLLSSQIRGEWCVSKDTEGREVRKIPEATLVNP